jgi:hypothetical protein
MRLVDVDKILLLDSQKSKTSSKFHIFKNGIIVILSTILVIAATLFIEIKLTDKYKQDLNSEHKNEAITDLPYGFVFVDEKADHGPITVDREKDDGTKLNIYDLIHPEDLSFYYNQENFDKLEDVVHPSKNNYFCEYNEDVPPEAYEGYEISCPAHYTIKIDYVFYGRHANDYEHCNINHKGEKIEKDQLEVDKECGNEPIDTVKEFCEGRVYCTLIPGGYIFNDSCEEKYKYLHVDYHCVKDKELKKEDISIVMFSDKVAPNSAYENAISSFYQYSKIHGYDFKFYHNRFDTERQIFYMKFNSIIETIIERLQEKRYGWIFWVDSDVILTNPNIRIETFLPNDKMNKIHFIASDDSSGLNAGVFLIRVHPWSLNLLMRAMAYSYFNKDKSLRFADQSSINNVLTETNDDKDHYIIVPQTWFNSYFGVEKHGDFILHLAGIVGKDNESKLLREEISNDQTWYGRTSKKMRKEVLKYYALPKRKQHKIKFEKRQLYRRQLNKRQLKKVNFV